MSAARLVAPSRNRQEFLWEQTSNLLFTVILGGGGGDILFCWAAKQKGPRLL